VSPLARVAEPAERDVIYARQADRVPVVVLDPVK
jgi:hypothetical protein